MLQGLKAFQQMPPEELELLFDVFERVEHVRGDVICSQGKAATHLGILRVGELSVSAGKAKSQNLQETGGFAYYGEEPLHVRALTSSK